MLNNLRSSFAYNDWANGKIIVRLNESDKPSARALRVLSHLLITEEEYLWRLDGRDSTGYDFWRELSLKECESLAVKNHDAHQKLFADLTEEKLETVAHYKNSKGVLYRNSICEMLTHVIYHSAYHRGQIAMIMRTDGIEPAYTDYIAYLRETVNHNPKPTTPLS